MMTVTPYPLEELEAKRAKASAGPWSTSAGANPDDVYEAALLNAAPSLIEELREARKRIADLENGIRFISAGVPVLQDMLATLKMSGANKAAEMVECAARLLQPAKETP